MKYRPFPLILFLSLATLAAQGQKTEIEFLVRPALTSLMGSSFTLDPTVKLSAGVGMNYFLKNNSLINVAILYDSRGIAKTETVYYNSSPDPGAPIVSSTVTNKVNYNYLTIPIQWGKRFGNKVKFQYGVGIYGSILLKAESVTDFPGLPASPQDISNLYKRADVGLSGSFAAYFPVNEKVMIKVGLDDNFGLLNTSSVPVVNDGSIRHNSLGLVIGANLKLK